MKYYGSEESGGVKGHYYHVFNTVCSTFTPASLILTNGTAAILQNS